MIKSEKNQKEDFSFKVSGDAVQKSRLMTGVPSETLTESKLAFENDKVN